MTRQGRTLLILGLISVGAVVALGAMAQRYRTLLASRTDAVPPPTTQAAREAEDEVAAYLLVRRALVRVISEAQERGEAASADAVRETLERALAHSGLDRRRFERIERTLRAWRAGAGEVSAEHRAAFARHEQELALLDLGPWDPLAL